MTQTQPTYTILEYSFVHAGGDVREHERAYREHCVRFIHWKIDWQDGAIPRAEIVRDPPSLWRRMLRKIGWKKRRWIRPVGGVMTIGV